MRFESDKNKILVERLGDNCLMDIVLGIEKGEQEVSVRRADEPNSIHLNDAHLSQL